MAQFYNTIKSMKTARVGTIMPWGGDGNEGFTSANVPKGWRVCDGRELNAIDFPLLASELGDTYGGSMIGEFPDYTGTFILPNLTNRCMIDLEKAYLGDPTYQYGQANAYNVCATLVEDYGATVVVPTLIAANADIDFLFPDPNVNLVGKYTGQSISDPDFFATISTLNRKLGMNHTPAHQHPGTFISARAGFFGAEAFTSTQVQLGGSQSHARCGHIVKSAPNECSFDPDEQAATSWRNGKQMIAYYGDDMHEDTLPVMDTFHEYISDTGKDYWSTVPAASWHDGTPTNNSPTGDYAINYSGDSFTDAHFYNPMGNDPTTTDKPIHYNLAWTGLFPRPLVFANRRNFYGTDTGSNLNGIPDNPEDPANKFTVAATIPASNSKFSLPAGTDIRTQKTSGTSTWYQYDKIRPFKMVIGPGFKKGSYITEIKRTGNNDSDYVYEITLNQNTNDTGGSTVTFQEGTYGTTLNTFSSTDPNDTTFTSHNHGTFDIQMAVGSLKPETTKPVTNVSLGNVNPQNFDNALNIIVDIAQPSMIVTYLIKAF